MKAKKFKESRKTQRMPRNQKKQKIQSAKIA